MLMKMLVLKFRNLIKFLLSNYCFHSIRDKKKFIVILFVSVVLLTFTYFIAKVNDNNKTSEDDLPKNDLKSFKAVNYYNQIQTTAQEMFNYISVTLNKTSELSSDVKQRIISEVSDMKNVLKLQADQLINTLELDQFKTEQLKSISKRIQDKISRLQTSNEFNCQPANQLICQPIIEFGFASGIHEILYCFIYGYFHNKTIILQADWRFYINSERRWESIFKPLTVECNHHNDDRNQNAAFKYVPLSNNVFARAIANHLPRDVGSELMHLVETPNAWFHGQFIGYIMRPQQRLVDYVDSFKRQANYGHPVVGIQVRRTDKLDYREALFYPIDDYMVNVKDYYDKLELTQLPSSIVRKRLVYVATDDPSVLPDLIKQYPAYKFIGSETTAFLASKWNRYSNSSLWGLLVDVNLLADADHLVCTFSSAVCRLAYELANYRKLDASHSYRSLDVPFHYHHSLTPPRRAMFNHRPKSDQQWQLKIGQQVHEPINTFANFKTEWFRQAVNGRGWDGYFYASDQSNVSATEKQHYKLYPHYKMHPKIKLI